MDIEHIKRRSVAGVVAHTMRTAVLQLIALVASLLLAAFLTPSEFGVFFSVSALVSLFIFLSDVGLAASLIQKKEPPSDDDLKTTFTVQQLLALTIGGVLVGLTPVWRHVWGLDQQGFWLLYALALSFSMASLKTIPSILLERGLEFKKLVIPQVLENIVFYSVAVFLAWRGNGVNSFAAAVVLRDVIGVIAIYTLSPWKIKLGISRESLKHLLRFGVPFQVNDLLARVKDDLLIVVMKRLLAADAIGYLGWAKKWSLTPFRFSVDSVVRVTFPAYSRLQHDTEHLRAAIEKSLFFIGLAAFPLLLGMAGMAYPLTVVIPQYLKWQPALPALYWFIADVCFSSMSVPLINALNAIGDIKKTLKLMSWLTVMIWVLALPLVARFGFVGVAMATAAVGAMSLISVVWVREKVGLSFIPQIWSQLTAGLIMLTVLIMLQNYSTRSLSWFFLVGVIGAGVYGVVVWLLAGRKILAGWRFMTSLRAPQTTGEEIQI